MNTALKLYWSNTAVLATVWLVMRWRHGSPYTPPYLSGYHNFCQNLPKRSYLKTNRNYLNESSCVSCPDCELKSSSRFWWCCYCRSGPSVLPALPDVFFATGQHTNTHQKIKVKTLNGEAAEKKSQRRIFTGIHPSCCLFLCVMDDWGPQFQTQISQLVHGLGISPRDRLSDLAKLKSRRFRKFSQLLYLSNVRVLRKTNRCKNVIECTQITLNNFAIRHT